MPDDLEEEDDLDGELGSGFDEEGEMEMDEYGE